MTRIFYANVDLNRIKSLYLDDAIEMIEETNDLTTSGIELKIDNNSPLTDINIVAEKYRLTYRNCPLQFEKLSLKKECILRVDDPQELTNAISTECDVVIVYYLFQHSIEQWHSGGGWGQPYDEGETHHHFGLAMIRSYNYREL